MSAVSFRIARVLRGVSSGCRSLSSSSCLFRIPVSSDNPLPLPKVKKIPDLSQFDLLYDDVEENSSIINLWKKQKAQELGSDSSTSANVDAIVRKERKIPNWPEDEPIGCPRQEVDERMLVENERDMFWSEDLLIPYDQFKKLSKKTLIVKRTVQMTRKGKVPSMYVLVVVGNGNGSAGYGEGKSTEATKAMLIATRDAIKHMQHFPRYDNRTIYHDIEHKFKATKLMLWARRPGFGCRAAPMIHEICECIGIHDLASKIHGSRNPMNVIKAFFEALRTQRVPDNLAKARGIRLVDINHTYYAGIRSTPIKR
ncbi:28S ribosomal protein S5, mitochondrial [Coemansia umbellata]|uniref:28S ribosomal protein S5, mitochondrial n=1 Tax=Coemansia umbellata TaxID=1424467 RepID=A0ABQ8PUX1_9FUNG|nr:28S ribosomal protein S5, mitochondrial [Coemansia umbellata]